MERLFLVTALSFSCVSLAFAESNTGFYTSIKSGVSDTNFNNYKNTFNFTYYEDYNYTQTLEHNDSDDSVYPNISVAAGFDFASISPVTARAELEYTYKDKMSFNPNINSLTYSIIGLYQTTVFYPQNIPGIFTNELRTQSLMLNSYYDFTNTSKFTPYLSTGVGLTHINYKQRFNSIESSLLATDSQTDNNFTWSVGAGVAYAVTKNVHLDLGYRYLDADKVEFTENALENINLKSSADLTSHNYSLGIRYDF